jgi:hypothetical protein
VADRHSSAALVADTDTHVGARRLDAAKRSQPGCRRPGIVGGPHFSALGRVVGGLPTIASDAVGAYLFLLDAAGIAINDQLGTTFSISEQASLEMADDPTGSSTTPTAATSMVSLFQVGSVGVKLEQHVNWSRLGAAAMVDSVNYLVEGSPA